MRWWTYQKERFPIFQHGPLVAAFSSCAVAYSSMLTGEPPAWQAFAVAFITLCRRRVDPAHARSALLT